MKTANIYNHIQIILLALSVGLVKGDGQIVQFSFPLNSGRFTNPLTAPVTSVFDHSMPSRYGSNGVVVAYTGETGVILDPTDSPVTSGSQLLYSFRKSDSSPFVINGHYQGTSPNYSIYLNYDGHPGYDYPATIGTPVYAVANGVVADVDAVGSTGAGRYFRILHTGTSYLSQYEHLSVIDVTNNQIVQRGDLIGLSGNSGGVPPHLHFETKMEIAGQWFSVDPYGWQGTGADPYTLAPNIYLWTNSQAVGEVITNVMSSVVSYQYFEALGTDTNSPIISPVVSYQYFDSLLGMGTNGSVLSLIASYQFPDWSIAPPLRLQLSAGGDVLTWPLSAADYTLETTTNLDKPNSWTPVASPTVVENFQNNATNPFAGEVKFYRLKK